VRFPHHHRFPDENSCPVCCVYSLSAASAATRGPPPSVPSRAATQESILIQTRRPPLVPASTVAELLQDIANALQYSKLHTCDCENLPRRRRCRARRPRLNPTCEASIWHTLLSAGAMPASPFQVRFESLECWVNSKGRASFLSAAINLLHCSPAWSTNGFQVCQYHGHGHEPCSEDVWIIFRSSRRLAHRESVHSRST